MNRQEYQRIIEGFMPSKDMRRYLIESDIDDETLSQIIRGAPVSLWKKARYAEGEDKEAVTNAIAALCNVRSGEVLYRKYCTYEPSRGECEHGDAPYLSYTDIINEIRYDHNISPDGHSRDVLEKWVSDGGGKMKLTYIFEVIGGEVMYFTDTNAAHPFRFSFEGRKIKLPTPFLAGDRVVIDCMVGMPPRNGVILTAGERLRALYRDDDGYYKIASLNCPIPGDVYCNVGVSPLFGLKYLRKKLPPKERLLGNVSKFIFHDEGRGAAVWRMIFEASSYGVTDDELMDIIS